MGLLAKGGDEYDETEQRVDLQLDTLVCPTCGLEVQPWVRTCPNDGSKVVSRTEAPARQSLEVPAHLLEGLDEDAAE